jgi:hypothetical protein
MDDWLAQQLRLSLFSMEPFPTAESSWTALTGQTEAENRVGVPGGRQYSGKHFGGLLALTIAGQRLDVVLAVDPANVMASADGVAVFPSVGPWKELSESFVTSVVSFLSSQQSPIVRIAFGASLLGRSETREQAYGNLAKLLASVDVDVENMRELIFRINWPQKSGVVPDLLLNRITGWGAITISINYMQIGSGVTVTSSSDEQPFAVSLDMDHNTAADRKEPFQNAQLVPIFRELVTLAAQNASSGERP